LKNDHGGAGSHDRRSDESFANLAFLEVTVTQENAEQGG
jgi:hypothetical protein